MRIAICYYGVLGSKRGTGGVGSVIPPEECFSTITKHVIDKNEKVDIFVHTWSVDYKDEIISLLKPRKFIIEHQINFQNSSAHKEPLQTFSDFRGTISRKLRTWLDPKYGAEIHNAIHRAYSRWYSTKKTLELKALYEIEQEFKYDFVLLMRFDVEFYTDLIFSKYNNEYFYAAYWNDLPRPENAYQLKFNQNHLDTGFLDLWFFSSSEKMDEFGKLYDNISAYSSSPHFASFQHVCKFIGHNKIRYTLFRWSDFEMIRAKKYGALPPHGGESTINLIYNKLHCLIKKQVSKQ